MHLIRTLLNGTDPITFYIAHHLKEKLFVYLNQADHTVTMAYAH